MGIKSILISDERFASGDLVNHAATGLPHDESVRYTDLRPVHLRCLLFMLGTRPAGLQLTLLYLHIQR